MYLPHNDNHQISSKATQFLVFSPNAKQHTEKQEPKTQLLNEYNTAWTDNVVKYKWQRILTLQWFYLSYIHQDNNC